MPMMLLGSDKYFHVGNEYYDWMLAKPSIEFNAYGFEENELEYIQISILGQNDSHVGNVLRKYEKLGDKEYKILAIFDYYLPSTGMQDYICSITYKDYSKTTVLKIFEGFSNRGLHNRLSDYLNQSTFYYNFLYCDFLDQINYPYDLNNFICKIKIDNDKEKIELSPSNFRSDIKLTEDMQKVYYELIWIQPRTNKEYKICSDSVEILVPTIDLNFGELKEEISKVEGNRYKVTISSDIALSDDMIKNYINFWDIYPDCSIDNMAYDVVGNLVARGYGVNQIQEKLMLDGFILPDFDELMNLIEFHKTSKGIEIFSFQFSAAEISLQNVNRDEYKITNVEIGTKNQGRQDQLIITFDISIDSKLNIYMQDLIAKIFWQTVLKKNGKVSITQLHELDCKAE